MLGFDRVRCFPSGVAHGSRQSVGSAAGERSATATLQPEDRAGLVALRSLDAVPTIRCDPMDHDGRSAVYPKVTWVWIDFVPMDMPNQ